MSGPEYPAAMCKHCDSELVAATRFCPHCGLSQTRRSYRGPIVLAVIATLLIVLGGGVGAATFSAMSADGFSGELADWAGPAINEVLAASGSSEIELIEGSGGGADTWVLVAFLAGVLVGLFGLFLACIAAFWAIVRGQAGRRTSAAYARSQPAIGTARTQATAQVERARPHVERAVHRGRTEVAPKVAEGARRGRTAVTEALERRRQRRS